MTLPGLTSWCMMPQAWQWRSAFASCMPMVRMRERLAARPSAVSALSGAP